MELFINISISLIIGGSAGCGLFCWLGKKWIANWFAKDLIKYEHELSIKKQEVDTHFAKNLQEYEHQLSLLKMKNEIQFSNVYTKRAEIIMEVYKRLVRVEACRLIIRFSKIPSQESKASFFYSCLDFSVYASENGIYFSEHIRTMIDTLIYNSIKPILTQEIETNPLSSNLTEDYKNMVQNIQETDIQNIAKELIKEFQRFLGIEEEK